MFDAYGDIFDDDVLGTPGINLVVFYSEWGYDGRAAMQWRQYKKVLRDFEKIVPKGVRIAIVDFRLRARACRRLRDRPAAPRQPSLHRHIVPQGGASDIRVSNRVALLLLIMGRWHP